MDVIQQLLESCGFAMIRMEDVQIIEKVYSLYLC